MQKDNNETALKLSNKRFGCLQVFGLTAIAVILSAGATILVFKTFFFPSEFKPVNLNSKEEKILSEKLELVNFSFIFRNYSSFR